VRRRGEEGSVALELVLLTPLVLVLVLFVTFCGRVTRAEAIVRDAAAAGARAASLRQRAAAAQADAHAAVLTSLSGHVGTCPTPAVLVDTAALRPGGRVAVEVRCATPLHDLGLLGVPGSRTVVARSVEVIDAWRGG
jgi:Flp pilus assembly protein TadG